MKREPENIAGTTGLMVGARLVSVAMGLISIPFLINSLGGEKFGAWALILALAAGFSLLDLGVHAIICRYVANPANNGDWTSAQSILGSVWFILACTYATGFIAALGSAGTIAIGLKLPSTILFSARDAILWVFAAVAVRAFLQTGVSTLYAMRRFRAAAASSLLQSLVSNVAAIVAAWHFRRLDITLISYWAAQLCVLGVVFVVSCQWCRPRLSAAALGLRRLRELCFFGLTSQMNQCSQFINFQFDKFIIAAFVGLWAVAPYEVANRSAQALRSVPASAADSLLPTAVIRQSTPDSAWAWYVSSSRIAAYGVCIFMLAPLAVAPMFLYAWTGEMGYVGRWIFLGLIVGAMADVLTLPAATIAQAGGQPGLQARSAAFSILINVPLSLALVLNWGLVGAAIGTGAALTLSSAQLLTAVHRHVERPLSATLRMFASFWPLLLVCIFWGAVSYALFSAWFATLDPAIRFSRAIRIYPGLAAIGIYVLCVVTMGWVEWKRGAFTLAERTSLSRLMKFEWLTGTATRTKP